MNPAHGEGTYAVDVSKHSVRRAVWEVTPPIVWRGVRRIFERRPEYEFAAQGFDNQAAAPKPGDVVDQLISKWPAFVEALDHGGPLAVNHEASLSSIKSVDDAYGHNLLMSFAYVLARTAHKLDKISILDWGGGLGHYYLIARAALPDVEIEYHCRDLLPLSVPGRRLLPEVAFHDEDSCLNRRYDLVLASGSLQYSRDWQGALARFAPTAERYLYLTRLNMVSAEPSFVIVQRLQNHGLDGETPMWVFNRDEIVNEATNGGLTLERTFRLADGVWIRGAPENPVREQGFLFAASGRS